MFVGALLDPHLDPSPWQKWSGNILLVQLYSTGTNGVNKMDPPVFLCVPLLRHYYF